MERISLRIGTLLLASLFVFTTLSSQERVKWLTWEDALAMSKVEKKKVIIDVYTDWCRYCKKMDKATFQNPDVAKYINENYYAIKFNAERREDIEFKGNTYKFVRGGRRGYHELAAQLLKGDMKYPTTVFLDEDLNVIQPLGGYQDASTMEMIISYFGEDHHKTTPWQRYASKYHKKSIQSQSVIRRKNH